MFIDFQKILIDGFEVDYSGDVYGPLNVLFYDL